MTTFAFALLALSGLVIVVFVLTALLLGGVKLFWQWSGE